MPVVTPNIARGRRLLLTVFVVASSLTLLGLLAWGLKSIGDQLPDGLGG